MPTSGPPQGPSPTLLFQTINAYQRTEAIKAAIELDLFTAIAEGNGTASALAQRCTAAERGVRMLADYLTIQGFLAKEGNRYGLTQDSALFLDRRSSAYAGSVLNFLLAPKFTEAFKDIAGAVRKGGTVTGEAGTVSPDHPIWVDFAKSMMPMMAKAAEEIAQIVSQTRQQPRKVLDIAAGHGLFGVEIAKRCPQAEIVALDWAGVLTVTQEVARKADVQDRYRPMPGDAFHTDFGTDYDLVLLTNFLHHFSQATCEGLLRKVHGGLTRGGRVFTLEFVPNDDRVSPPLAGEFALIMLATTPDGDAYTLQEYKQMFRAAGFTRTESQTLADSPELLLISYQ